ncbi:MAG TPA: molybdopterin-binding protein [Blastocatellia bacterium]|nr:molybdopterin-binding protein [Blastocatellia bacterium]
MSAMRQKTAAIVVIGNEILTGKSEDKNASFLIGEMYNLGVALRRILIIPDDADVIATAVRECAAEFDYVFTSGGVGPTHDDVTIEGVARAFDREVVRHPELETMLRGYFGEGIDAARLRMADTPAGSELIHDSDLRWPVLAVQNVIVLPGVPELFRKKFEAIRERFRAAPFFAHAIYTREDEFDIAPRLDDIAAKHPDVEIGSYPTFTREDYRVKITLESKEEAAVERARDQLLSLLDPGSLARIE